VKNFELKTVIISTVIIEVCMDLSQKKFLNYVNSIPIIFLGIWLLFPTWVVTPYLFVISVGLIFVVWIINSDFLNAKYVIDSFILSVMVLEVFIVFVITELSLILLLGYTELMYKFFNLFEINRFIIFFTDIRSSLGFSEIITIVTLFFLYIYLISYINLKKGYIFDTDEEGSKYSLGVVSIINLFSLAIITIFDVYLLNKNYLFELLLITLIYLITRIFIAKIFQAYKDVSVKYENLIEINDLISGKNVYSRANKSSDEKQKNFDKFIDSLIWNIFSMRESFINLIFISTFLILIIGIIFQFNLISILILESCYVSLYWIVSLTFSLPKKQYNIYTNYGPSFENVFILRELKNGNLLILNEENKQITLSKQSVGNIQEI
jgi:hypothetical protein